MKSQICWSAAAALVLLTGCQDTVNTIENEEKTMTQNIVKDTRFETDTFLRNRLKLKSLQTGKTADGLLTVQLEVVNMRVSIPAQWWSHVTGENPYRIRYKFNWFYADGRMVETILSTWQDASIVPGETLYLQSVAPNRECKDFKISLRENEGEEK